MMKSRLVASRNWRSYVVVAGVLSLTSWVSASDEPGSAASQSRVARDKLAVWSTQLKGAVYGGYYAAETVAADLDAAREHGVRVVRLFFPGVESTDPQVDIPGAMTAADLADVRSGYYRSARFERALQNLDRVITLAGDRGLHVVISPGPVPGSHGKGPVRWRLYRDDHWHRRFARFWRRLAARYKDNPVVVGYLLLNEPGFEVTQNLDYDDERALQAYADRVRGTPADLNRLYRRTLRLIREVDRVTPVIVQPGHFGRPRGLAYLDPLEDDRVLYSVHWYAPWLCTTWRHNRGRWEYPGPAPTDTAGDPDAPGPLVPWGPRRHRARFVAPVRAWQRRHNIPSNRIFVGEFGIDRRVPGAAEWLHDVAALIDEQGWHWTYYMFREREWNALDQELGAQPEARVRRSDTPAMTALRAALRRAPSNSPE